MEKSITTKGECLAASADIAKAYASAGNATPDGAVKMLESIYLKLTLLLQDAAKTS